MISKSHRMCNLHVSLRLWFSVDMRNKMQKKKMNHDQLKSKFLEMWVDGGIMIKTIFTLWKKNFALV